MTTTGAVDEHVNCRPPESRRIFALVVTFNPDPIPLDELLAATCTQVERILVIDNHSKPECVVCVQDLCTGRATLYPLPSNLGIAAAQNHGIALAREAGATDILLLDHDSLPSPGMVAALSLAAEDLRLAGVAVAAVGPVIVDRRSGAAAAIPQIVEGAVQFIAPTTVVSTRCEYLIASGMLIALEVLDSVGLMDEDYFIDQVDVEWCLRARVAGLDTYCVSGATLLHAIGDNSVRFWAFGWRQLAVHSPSRDYFYFRNSVRLTRSGLAAPEWQRFWRRRLLRLLILQTLFVPPRWQRFRAMVSGAWAGTTDLPRLHRSRGSRQSSLDVK